MRVSDDPELLGLVEDAEEASANLTYLLGQDDDGVDFHSLEYALLAVCDELVAVRNDLRTRKTTEAGRPQD